ncbi:MAG: helix-turn-helix transcriptional regulator [Sedimenticola sp.]
MNTPTPLPVERALKKLGSDISLARRRRNFSQASLAVRLGCSVMTVRRMEKGNPNISIHYFARMLHIIGELDKLNLLLDTAQDSIGLTLMDEKLPKRVRTPKADRDEGAL